MRVSVGKIHSRSTVCLQLARVKNPFRNRNNRNPEMVKKIISRHQHAEARGNKTDAGVCWQQTSSENEIPVRRFSAGILSMTSIIYLTVAHTVLATILFYLFINYENRTQSTDKNKNKRKKTKANPYGFVATFSTINESSEAEKVLSSENLRTVEPSRIFVISNND